MVARSGVLILTVVDSIMIGRASAGELAFFSLGFALFVVATVQGWWQSSDKPEASRAQVNPERSRPRAKP